MRTEKSSEWGLYLLLTLSWRASHYQKGANRGASWLWNTNCWLWEMERISLEIQTNAEFRQPKLSDTTDPQQPPRRKSYKEICAPKTRLLPSRIKQKKPGAQWPNASSENSERKTITCSAWEPCGCKTVVMCTVTEPGLIQIKLKIRLPDLNSLNRDQHSIGQDYIKTTQADMKALCVETVKP